jgi:hypothetical protein
MKLKQRTLNELRQEKEYGYKNTTTEYKKLKVNPRHIVELTKTYPNDTDLGKEVRKYLIELGLYE